MSVFQIIMLCVVLSVAWVSRQNVRGLVVLGALITDYLVSSTWWDLGGGAPELVAGLCDAAVCLVLWRFGRKLWECWVWLVFLTMLGINFVYLANNLTALHLIPHNVYASVLEVMNLVALALIGGVSAYERSGNTGGRAWHPWRSVFGLSRSFAGSMDDDPPGSS